MKHKIYPKEVISVIAAETNQLENVINSFGSNGGEETEFDVSIVGLQPQNQIASFFSKPHENHNLNLKKKLKIT